VRDDSEVRGYTSRALKLNPTVPTCATTLLSRRSSSATRPRHWNR
jgi:hypothetical protein